MPFDQEQLEAIQEAVATALAQQQQQAPPVVPQADLAAAAAAAVAAAAPQVAAVDINAISHTIPSFWPEDVDGFFSTFEAACVNKKITQDGTKYSKLLSVLTAEARSRMVGHLPEPGTNPDDYKQLKAKLKEAYTKTKMERCAELLSITTLGDRNPEHLLSYMRGLMPGEVKSDIFRYVWLSALPDSIHEVLSADDSELGVLATRATRMLKEKAARKKRAMHVNAVRTPEAEGDRLEVDAVTGGAAKVKAGVVCTNHLRFPGNCFRCFDPERCLLKDTVIPRPAGAGSNWRKAGNAKAGRQ